MLARREQHSAETIAASRWAIIHRKLQERNAAKAVSIFRENDIEPVLIKGVAALRYYPESHLRYAVDVDLAVDPARFNDAKKLIYEFKKACLGVDIHKGIRHLDTLEWDDLFRNSITIDIDHFPLRILRAEDHLRLLCVHWLTDGGAYRERLWDIYYGVTYRPSDFDWNRCLNVVSDTRRRWIVSVIGLAHKYLDLKIDDLPFAEEAKDLPVWLVRAVEMEWKSDVRLTSIDIFVRDPAKFIKQLRKRLPPNPIQATIECEGSFAARTRVHYQFKSFFRRLGPSVKRVARSIFQRH